MGATGGTREQIRRRVANMLDDFTAVTADRDTDTNSLHDAQGLGFESGYFTGAQAYVISGDDANAGQTATVTHSDGPNRTISFEPSLPVAVTVGTAIELYNRKKMGSTVAQYNEAINAAIRALAEQHAMLPLHQPASGPFDRRYPELPVSASFAAAYGVSLVAPNGLLTRIPAQYVRIDRDTRTIAIASRWAQRAHGRSLVVHGYQVPEELQTDYDTTNIEAEWLYPEIKANILERHMASGIPVGVQDRLYMQERQQADSKRNIAIRRYAPNTVRFLS